jgi:hypothetical protein
VKQNEESFKIFEKYFIFEMESWKLINYFANMCWSHPCTMVITWPPSMIHNLCQHLCLKTLMWK